MAGLTQRAMEVEGRAAVPADGDQTLVNYQVVSPSYFSAIGISVLRGRTFTQDDRLGTVPVAVISDRTARRFWPCGDPVGQRVRTTQRTAGSGVSADAAVVYEIVGVVADVHFRSLSEPPGFDLYTSVEQTFSGDTFFVLRTAGEPAAVASALAGAIRDVDPHQSVFDVRPMAERIAAASWQQRTAARVLGVLAGIGLVVAVVGIYGVLAYGVARRERELGVRVALGAQAAAIRRLVLRHGLRPVAIGAAIGLVVAAGLGQAIGSLLHGVSPLDPLALVGAPAALAAVATLACLVPALRAARVDPVVALRAE